MPARTAARAPAGEAERRHILVAIESMLRENRTESEIVEAVRSMTGEPAPVAPEGSPRRRSAPLGGVPGR